MTLLTSITMDLPTGTQRHVSSIVCVSLRHPNSILWPLFHYQPGDINFNEEHWEAYQVANIAFADALMEVIREGDIVWIHDYHLMLLPALLRQRLERVNLDVKIGFFLHTPFPSSEIYRYELLDGLYFRELFENPIRVLGSYP
jgi:Glycosyltransferase family 20